ncbi:MAG TPA: ribose-phosphate diphosphokinase [Methanofastidiosum sp.]|jgi:ribose-phosphate pyrophosphokinase|nr:ribose-phosphate diphosphokinase [Methanofastidiosum sp.]HOE92369.1 ribose-phosphate diphosphokinase [Methanofastidiosum sp.]HOR87563.1 ribose-phosphate diphosphokinase [Methanofastidiosum sp.]HOT85302.1 ribose-phosphate diphosphokinase [Methanofastidiosum sp.]HPK99748.1 ribose-phosphate diphosphokinase [Methanofastidiosum sp.]
MFITSLSSKTTLEKLKEDFKIIDCHFERFPDGEGYVRFDEKVKKIKEILIVQSLYYPQDEHIMQLFFMIDALKDLNIKVDLLIPYMAYARQDKRFKDWESVSGISLAKMIGQFEIECKYTVDIHNINVTKAMKGENLSAMPLIADYLTNLKLNEPVIISPDKGSIERAKIVANHMDAEFDYLEKTRVTGEIVEMKPKEINTKNRDVVIVDDIISTGGTMAKACEILKREGTLKVLSGATHLLMISNAEEKLKIAGIDRIFGTDSIPSKFSDISIANIIKELY